MSSKNGMMAGSIYDNTYGSRDTIRHSNSNYASDVRASHSMEGVLAAEQIETTGLTLPICGFKVIESNSKARNMQAQQDRVAVITGTGDLSANNNEEQGPQGVLSSLYLVPKRFIKAIFSGDQWFSH